MNQSYLGRELWMLDANWIVRKTVSCFYTEWKKLTTVSLSQDFKTTPNLWAVLLSCPLISITFFCTKEICHLKKVHRPPSGKLINSKYWYKPWLGSLQSSYGTTAAIYQTEEILCRHLGNSRGRPAWNQEYQTGQHWA